MAPQQTLSSMNENDNLGLTSVMLSTPGASTEQNKSGVGRGRSLNQARRGKCRPPKKAARSMRLIMAGSEKCGFFVSKPLFPSGVGRPGSPGHRALQLSPFAVLLSLDRFLVGHPDQTSAKLAVQARYRPSRLTLGFSPSQFRRPNPLATQSSGVPTLPRPFWRQGTLPLNSPRCSYRITIRTTRAKSAVLLTC
ncbi:hypothetical protein VTK26DRAFT_8543 [Humicola hyalothermophila]